MGIFYEVSRGGRRRQFTPHSSQQLHKTTKQECKGICQVVCTLLSPLGVESLQAACVVQMESSWNNFHAHKRKISLHISAKKLQLLTGD